METRHITTYGGFDWGKWLAVAGLALLVLVLVCGLAYSVGYTNGENAAVARLGR